MFLDGIFISYPTKSRRDLNPGCSEPEPGCVPNQPSSVSHSENRTLDILQIGVYTSSFPGHCALRWHLREGQKIGREKPTKWIFTRKGKKVTTVQSLRVHCSPTRSSKKSVSWASARFVLMSESCRSRNRRRRRRRTKSPTIYRHCDFFSVKTDLRK